METKHQITKFGQAFPLLIRKEYLPEGEVSIAFCISGTDLSVMQDSKNFDAESDLVIEKIKAEGSNSKKHRAFEYIPNFGFDEVDSEQQKWFKF